MHDVLLQLFNVHLRLAVFELGAVLVGLGQAIAQRHLELQTDLVLGRRVVQGILERAAVTDGSRGAAGEVRIRVCRRSQCRQ